MYLECEKHHEPLMKYVSKDFFHLHEKGHSVNAKDIYNVHIYHLHNDKTFSVITCYIDKKLFDYFFPNDQTKTQVTLTDKDKFNKLLNDRVIIVKLMKELKLICPICLENLIHPS